MSTLSSVPEEKNLTPRSLAIKLLHKHLVSVEAEDSFDGKDILVSDYDEIISVAEALINQQIKSVLDELENEAIGEDYPRVTRRYSGGIWLGDTRLNWADVERARRHFESRNAEKAVQRRAIQKIRSRYE